MATEPQRAPGWRREPYRVLFPLGAGLAVVAVLPFVAGGAGGGALGVFHPLAQIDGFLSCFLAGVLFTFVPRQTRTPPPGRWQMLAALALPLASVASAWAGRGALAHGLWLALAAVVLGFTVRRVRVAGGTPPPAVAVWVPLSILAGATGALLSALAPLASATSAPRAWIIGRGLLAQGFVTGLVLGVGAILLPRLTRGEDAVVLRPERLRRAAGLHAIAALAFFGSFPVEVLYDARLGMALRALVATLVLVLAAGIHRPPTLPGVHRQLVWIASWLLPLGFWLAALAPRLRTAALHVVFVGGFTQLTLAVAAHVVLSRGGRGPALEESPWTARAVAALLALAVGARLLAAIDLARIPFWLAVAGMAFIGAVLAWAALVRPVTTASGGSP
ncbi:NnrS family protein [Anaeromyxobacter terrae]|uniref:NnrS family protein n=1 Tax=Anaeromyxobacter terrae TaxID=2925406 RepID=UPI001F58A808|nr:NnrS family protein [Anaeromyxobacter sp. SG22]